MLKTFYQYVSGLLTLIASIIALIFYFLDVNLSADGKFALYLISFFALTFFIENLYLRVSLKRRASYGDALPYINDGFKEIHELIRCNKLESDLIIAYLEKLCSELVSAFQIITGVKCAVCIKLLRISNEEQKATLDNIGVYTLIRDHNSKSNRDFAVQDKENFLIDNTAFLSIFNHLGLPKGNYFFSNMLPLYKEYKNISFKHYGEPYSKKILILGKVIRYIRWTLPYKSTIVVPICPGIQKQKIQNNFHGFLCVDSNRPFAFRRSYDTDLMMGVSDGIYNIIKNLKSLL